MALALRSGLHYRRFDAEYVFFDLAADRYFMLSGVAANRFGRFVSGRASAADHEHLLASDILAEGSGRTMRDRSEEHTSELQSLMRISYAVFCLKTKKTNQIIT